MKKIFNFLKKHNKTISFMESCTGGFLVNSLTNIAGASDVIKVSLVTYSNEYKIKFGVPEKIINKYSVYSIEVAKEMAKCVSEFSSSDYGIGITGTLWKADKNNEKEEINKVYLAIYDYKLNTYITHILIVQQNTRNNMKKQIEKTVEQIFLEKI